MAGDNDENGGEGSSSMAVMEEKPIEEKKLTTEGSFGSKKKKKKKGVLSRLWSGVFGARKDDIERRLERITKEETTILNRMRRRAHTWGQRKRQIILFCVTLEIIAVGYAIATAKTLENWKIRSFRVLPMFLLPALSYFLYSALAHFINMREQKDNKTLENLRVERQTKIDELKEKTNYYITQQLIQRYDTDPAAKAAAAQVLASKLGTDSGLKFFLENETRLYGASAGKSSDAEASAQSGGLRNRKQPISTAASVASTAQHSNETTPRAGSECGDNQFQFIEHYQPSQGGQTAGSGGWLSHIAALLVGEDPTQCYALICGNCHMHNGLASKEDFPYVTYICPHCQLVNGPKNRQENPSAPTTPNMGSMTSADLGNANGSASDSAFRNYIERSFSDTHPPLAPDRADKTEELAEGPES